MIFRYLSILTFMLSLTALNAMQEFYLSITISLNNQGYILVNNHQGKTDNILPLLTDAPNLTFYILETPMMKNLKPITCKLDELTNFIKNFDALNPKGKLCFFANMKEYFDKIKKTPPAIRDFFSFDNGHDFTDGCQFLNWLYNLMNYITHLTNYSDGDKIALFLAEQIRVKMLRGAPTFSNIS